MERRLIVSEFLSSDGGIQPPVLPDEAVDGWIEPTDLAAWREDSNDESQFPETIP